MMEIYFPDGKEMEKLNIFKSKVKLGGVTE